jgi:hypothetical protein
LDVLGGRNKDVDPSHLLRSIKLLRNYYSV